MKKARSFLIWCFLFLPAWSWAQSDFTLKGEVRDATTGDALIGASVVVQETRLGTTTDVDGSFSLQGISNPAIILEVSYLGYETIIQALNLKTEAKRSVLIKLKSAAVELQEVEIRGQAEGTIRAMIEQKQAESIKNIISAEQIATFPDMNAAEVMQRIPGITLQRDQGEGRYVQLRGTPPELTTFNINGEQIPSPEANVRYVGMDIIPSDQIEFIEVNKVLTPDMDADGIAGSVNIKTKEASSAKPELRATLAGGYGHLRQTPNYQVQYSYGQRYGKFGFHINSSYFRNEQGSDNIEYKFAKGPFFGSQQDSVDNYYVQYREVQLRHYDITRTRIGISPTLDLRFNKNSFLYLRGMYNSFTDDETRRRLIYELDDALNATYYLFGGVEHDVKDRIKKQELTSLSLGGEHRIGRATVDYQLFYALAVEAEPDRLESVFESPGQAIAIDFDLTDPEFPRATFPNPDNAPNATNYAEFEMDELLLESTSVTDRNFTPRINLSIPLSLSNSSEGYFKIGGKMRLKDKSRDIQSQVFGAYFPVSTLYPGEGPELSLLTVDDGFREDNLLGKGYQLEYMPSADMLRGFFEFYPQHFIFDRTGTRSQSFGEDYSAEEKIYAAYGMIRQDFGKMMVLGGLRFEKTDIDYEGRKVLLDGNRFVGLDTLTDQRSHEFLLPQVQLRYALNSKINLRAALTYSYSRPNFEDVLPYREQDREEVKFGNPDLIYPTSMNVDLLAERFYGRSIISGGLFYKEIDDFIFFFKRFAHEGTDFSDFGLVEITKAINGLDAKVFGGEFQAQFKLDFLPGFLKNFGIYTNYTYTHSEARINRRFPANYATAVVIFGEDDLSEYVSSDEQEKISLPGQAKHTANLAFFYDAKNFFARITANYQDDFLFRLGADPDLDEYYDSALRFDFTSNYQLTKHISIFLDALNLSNTPLRYYLGTEDRTQKQEYYSWWGRFGVKLQF
ncbi:MAG TPA: TonB-dependent receptor [Saprospiraceae bacterium]|nr:TonB-dependent receptor [Saprospiraceae bacterium]HMQ83597.1 TonB-dependent receptor [Saprospiraceae bacterium]